uniref:ShiF n=1 Tax=Escherichia coli TaxID=562 RepID=Q3L7J6_ECOLX|nr:ShiF [Escherichia coli]
MGSGRIWRKLYPAWAGKRADGYRCRNNSGGVGNINHRPDRLRSDRVSNGASLSGLGIAESGRRESHGRSGNHQLRPELRQAIRAAVRGGNVGHSPSGASVDADGSSGVGCGDASAVARHTTTANDARASWKRDCLPYLLCAMLLAAAMSMMQLGLSPALTRQFDTDTTTISQQVAWLLGLSAIAALIAHFVVLRPQRLTPVALLLSAGVLMSSGLAIMLTEQLWLFYLGCAVLSFGAALATPAYQLLLNDKLADAQRGLGLRPVTHLAMGCAHCWCHWRRKQVSQSR